jgi:hypothetical protein
VPKSRQPSIFCIWSANGSLMEMEEHELPSGRLRGGVILVLSNIASTSATFSGAESAYGA